MFCAKGDANRAGGKAVPAETSRTSLAADEKERKGSC